MASGFANVGKVWTIVEFASYLRGLQRPRFAKAIVLHHTAAPSLAQRPASLSRQHLINLHDFYQNKMGWRTGPHLFVDDQQETDGCIKGLTPLDVPGSHAVSFNHRSIGIEVLGNYDVEDPFSGRGLECWRNAASATKLLLQWLGLETNATTVLFHRDDPKTSKTCPGSRIQKGWVLGLINQAQH